MKKILKFLAIVIVIGGVVAGVLDRIKENEREARAHLAGQKPHRPYGPYEKYFKRPLDFMLSAWALVVLSPVLAVTSWLVGRKLGKPVLFTQERPGRDGEVFRIYKFRSMTDERDEAGELLPDEDRLTDFGKTLRSTSLDELPELYSILRGDMSIVGPRPLLVEYLPRYNEKQKHRHDVRPGLTGLAQISGRNGISWEEKFDNDVNYVNRITLAGDAMIILETVRKVVSRDGISSETSATMEVFEGTEEN
ncbi:MAG: sugar transferase [Eubacterium sp.]|nr:sugar transferase [Eubacterium sp.]